MDYLFLLGRVLFGGFFVLSGLKHLTGLAGMTGYAQMKKVPAAKFGVIVSGLMILLGGIGVITGIYTTISLWLIIIFLVLVTFKMHAYWAVTDVNMKMAEQVNFKKNLALLGAALMLLALATPWAMSVTL